jgi:hypothetical protein
MHVVWPIITEQTVRQVIRLHTSLDRCVFNLGEKERI